MTFSDIRQLVSLKLGEQTAFFTDAEVGRAVNTAQRLLCLRYPVLLRNRATLTVNANNPFIDLRTLQNASGGTIGNRLRRVRRVMLGSVMADAPTRNATTDGLFELRLVGVQALACRARDWLHHQGDPRYYYLHGSVWLGMYPRPIAATTITVVFDAAPHPLLANSDVPQVDSVYHRVMADIAFGLLLVKEGNQRSITLLVSALGVQQRQEGASS